MVKKFLPLEKPEGIYLAKMKEVKDRVAFTEELLKDFNKNTNYLFLESAILQLRKALECVAFASIAPNKKEYERIRLQNNQADYRNDYHARRILNQLSTINKNFYPKALLPAMPIKDKHWHFELRETGYLTKNQFIKLYDRIGKFLHADNPWGHEKGLNNFAKEMPGKLDELRLLLHTHSVHVQKCVYVIQMGLDDEDVRILTAKAE